MTKIELKYSDDRAAISKVLTWGIHKELSNYLMADGRLMTIFTNDDTTENIMQICLSKRDTYGEIIEPFTSVNSLDVESVMLFLTELHNYFENFFFQNQQRVDKMAKKFQETQNTSQ